MIRRSILVLLLLMVATLSGIAAVRTELVTYTVGGVTFEGYLAFNDSLAGPRPAVLVVHDWNGLNDYARSRANQLAELGYVAFAVDMYGKGQRAHSNDEASRLAAPLRADRVLMRARINAALELLRKDARVDAGHIAAIGYCFGGTVVLELARSGASLAGVVSFHGGLDTPNPQSTPKPLAKILVLHGADDPFVTTEQANAFQDEMRRAGADWQFVAYCDAVHGFTNPGSGSDKKRGMAYNAVADRRSWSAMRMFFDEILK